MSSLVVGGVAIPVAPGSGSWDWNDQVDRRRSFDGSYRASATGGAARDGRWTTPPVTRANAAIYRAALQKIDAQLCTGDLIEIPTMCCSELIDERPVKVQSGSYVSLDFALHEVQGKKLLLKYSPGDTITGESFARSGAGATYRNSSGQVVAAGANVKRDSHYIGGVRSLLLEDARINFCTFSEDLTNAAWIKGNATINANAATAPDGNNTGDKLQEDNTNSAHYAARTGWAQSPGVNQAWSFFALPAERSWVRVTTVDRAGGTRHSWVNLSTGAIGTKDSGHIIRVTSWVGGWWRIECVFPTATGAGSVDTYIVVATADAVQTYLGTTGSGIYVWGAQFEQDNSFASSYIPATAGSSVTRNADSYSAPFTTPPQEMTVYAKFAEGGTSQLAAYRLWQISNAANATPEFLVYGSAAAYHTYHASSGVADAGNPGAVAFGDTVEHVSRLFGDGSVDNVQSVNTGATTTATQTSAIPLASAWSGQLLWLNSMGTSGNVGFTAIQSFKIVAGARSLAEMRAA